MMNNGRQPGARELAACRSAAPNTASSPRARKSSAAGAGQSTYRAAGRSARDQCVFSLFPIPAKSSSSMPSPLLPRIVPVDLTARLDLTGGRCRRGRGIGIRSGMEQAPPHAGNERRRGRCHLKSPIALRISGFAETRLDAQPWSNRSRIQRTRTWRACAPRPADVWTALGDSDALHTVRADAERSLIG